MISAKMVLPFSFTFSDYPDPDHACVVVYFIGCEHNCNGCHNTKFQSIDNWNSDKPTYLDNFDENTLYDLLQKETKRSRTNKVVFSGGDPLFRDNIQLINNFLDKYAEEFDICIYTGYDIDFIKNNLHSGFKFIKSGKYDKLQKSERSTKTDEYIQFASINQKLYDAKLNLLSNDARYYF